MTRFNEILIGRWNRGIQKLTGMKGEAPAPQLATEVMPTIQIPLGAEFRYLESWDRFGAALQATGGAGQTAGIRLRNPAGSNVVAVIESLLVSTSSGAAQQFRLGIASTAVDLTSVVASTGNQIDPRGRASTALIGSTTTNLTVTGPDIYIIELPTAVGTNVNFIVTDNQELPLLPGMAMTVEGFTPAGNVITGWLWRERFLEESERA